MADARHELKEAVEHAIEHLKAVADRHPDAGAKADVFNMLLARVKQTFPDSEIVKDLEPVDGGTTAADLVFRLSVMAGAIKSDFAVEKAAAVAKYNEGIRQRSKRSGWLDR